MHKCMLCMTLIVVLCLTPMHTLHLHVCVTLCLPPCVMLCVALWLMLHVTTCRFHLAKTKEDTPKSPSQAFMKFMGKQWFVECSRIIARVRRLPILKTFEKMLGHVYVRFPRFVAAPLFGEQRLTRNVVPNEDEKQKDEDRCALHLRRAALNLLLQTLSMTVVSKSATTFRPAFVLGVSGSRCVRIVGLGFSKRKN